MDIKNRDFAHREKWTDLLYQGLEFMSAILIMADFLL